MKSALLVAICIAAMAFFAPPARACDCPPGLASPLQLIDGQTWVFHTQSGGNPFGQASIGKFTAKYKPPTTNFPYPQGTLVVSETLIHAGTVTRLAGIAGRYIIYPDCSGGEIMIMLAGQQIQYEFVFANNFTEMFLLNEINGTRSRAASPGITEIPVLFDPDALAALDVIWGTAKLGPPGGCDGTTPLGTLAGPLWSFRTFPGYFHSSVAMDSIVQSDGISFTLEPPGSIGTFTATASSTGTGLLSGVHTWKVPGGDVSRLEPFVGKYQVYPDCSGGVLSIMGGNPVQYEFLFVKPDFSKIWMVATSPQNRPEAGEAKKF
jgi:hypothetical protein